MGMFRFYDFIFPLLIFVSDVSIVLGKVAPSVVQFCPLLPCGHRSDGERTLLSIYA